MSEEVMYSGVQVWFALLVLTVLVSLVWVMFVVSPLEAGLQECEEEKAGIELDASGVSIDFVWKGTILGTEYFNDCHKTATNKLNCDFEFGLISLIHRLEGYYEDRADKFQEWSKTEQPPVERECVTNTTGSDLWCKNNDGGWEKEQECDWHGDDEITSGFCHKANCTIDSKYNFCVAHCVDKKEYVKFDFEGWIACPVDVFNKLKQPVERESIEWVVGDFYNFEIPTEVSDPTEFRYFTFCRKKNTGFWECWSDEPCAGAVR